MKTGIYKITNNLNNHFYIGQSINIQKRWKEHIKSAKAEKTHYTSLQKAFHKYGIENFTFKILEECSKNKLDEREMFYIAALKPEYNMNEGGVGNKGHVVTDETKKILSNLGRKQWDSYDDEKRKIIIKNQLTGPCKGSHRSEETKKILSEKTKDYFKRNNGMSEEQKRKISESLKGKRRPNLLHYKPVCATSKEGVEFYFPCILFASIILDVDKSTIGNCCKGKRKSAGGYSWKYCSQETIQYWSREDLITSRSAIYPTCKDKDIVHTVTKNRSYGEYDKGIIALARRSNTIKTIAAEPIHENDIFDIELGMNRHLSHKIDIRKERGEVIAYYCLVELTNGGVQFAVMTKKDAENHRDKFSKAYKKDDKENIWNKNFDAMALKSVVIKTLKLCPISIEALEAVSREEMNDTILDPSDYEVMEESVEATPDVQDAEIVEPQKIEQPKVEEKKSTLFEKMHSVEPKKETPAYMELSPEEEKQADEAFGPSGQSELGFAIF